MLDGAWARPPGSRPDLLPARRLDGGMGATAVGRDAAPINPCRVIAELNRVVDQERTIVTHDAGGPRDQLSPFWESPAPLSYIGWGKSTQLGYGLGLAMGAKLAHPEKLCVNVWGDAAIGFTGMDFETAVREQLPDSLRVAQQLLDGH